MEVLAWIATVISIIGIILNAKKQISCWPVWIVSNILWIIYFASLDMTPSVVLWIVFTIFNVYGWRQWYKDNQI
jgi:nicotinamide mononucleotide transporter